ncbi:MAG: Fur family transcriptional regulator [Spirochaetota bacterium]
MHPSAQRIAILKFLHAHRIHPTAEDIYGRLHPSITTLSRTTVYNTLKLFAENGIVQVLTIEEKEARYDIDTSHHGHFKCDACGKVYDFTADAPGQTIPELKGFTIKERHLYYRGTCAACCSQRR